MITIKRQDFQSKLRNEILEKIFRAKRKNLNSINFCSVDDLLEILPKIVLKKEIDKIIKVHILLFELADTNVLILSNYIFNAYKIITDFDLVDCHSYVLNMLYCLSQDAHFYNQGVDKILDIIDESLNILRDVTKQRTQSSPSEAVLEFFYSLICNNNQCYEYLVSNNLITSLNQLKQYIPLNMNYNHSLIIQIALIILERNPKIVPEITVMITFYLQQNFNNSDFYSLLLFTFKQKLLSITELICSYLFDFNNLNDNQCQTKLELLLSLLTEIDDKSLVQYLNIEMNYLFNKFNYCKFRKILYYILQEGNYKFNAEQKSKLLKSFQSESLNIKELILPLLDPATLSEEDLQLIFDYCLKTGSEELILQALYILSSELQEQNLETILQLQQRPFHNHQLINLIEDIVSYYV